LIARGSTQAGKPLIWFLALGIEPVRALI
jgi:hypothetical protein